MNIHLSLGSWCVREQQQMNGVLILRTVVPKKKRLCSCWWGRGSSAFEFKWGLVPRETATSTPTNGHTAMNMTIHTMPGVLWFNSIPDTHAPSAPIMAVASTMTVFTLASYLLGVFVLKSSRDERVPL